MIEAAASDIAAFAVTNIDDIVMLAILYAQAGINGDKAHIAVGRYIGTCVLLAVSILGIYGVSFLSDSAVGLLGFVPIAIGIKSFFEYRREKNEDNEAAELKKITILESAVLTIANGADNLGVYIAVFSRFIAFDILLMLVIFAVLPALLCYAGKRLADRKCVRSCIQKYQSILVSAVLIALGIMILLEYYCL